MPLTESFKKKYFGNVEPQVERDYDANNILIYEGYATPSVSTSAAGWVILKHTISANMTDLQSQPKLGVIWDLRTIYDYSTP